MSSLSNEIRQKRFPESMVFKNAWRSYQARVLQHLDSYLDDKRVHIVAAPGSGKTVLGLEIIRRIDQPTLVLAPTITIRDQWVDRLVGLFLPIGSSRPSWISTDLRKPAPLTIVTPAVLKLYWSRMNQEGFETEKRASPAEPRATGSILSIDYGRERMGLAIADANVRMAQPLSTMERVNRNEDLRRLRELVREHGVKLVIVGLPLKLDGTRGEMAEEAERFARRVQKQIGVPVELVDERLTSWEAERLLEETQGRFLHVEKSYAGRKQKKVPERATVDAVAAAVILKEYFERQEQPAEPR